MKTGLPYGVVNTNSQKRCLFCGTGLPNAQQSVEQHVKSKRHKENITLMTEHGIYYHDDALYCKPCKCHLGTEESVGRHIEGGDHSTWMAAIDEITDGEFVSLDSFLSTESDQEAQCEACNTAIDCSLSAIEEHVNSSPHRINVTEKLKPLNGIFRVENEEELWCKICDVYIDNTVQGIFDHIDDDKQHTDWFSYMDDLLEYEDITIGDYLANEHENCAFCSKCQSDVPCDFQSIEDHIESDEHVRHYITEG